MKVRYTTSSALELMLQSRHYLVASIRVKISNSRAFKPSCYLGYNNNLLGLWLGGCAHTVQVKLDLFLILGEDIRKLLQ